MQPQQKREQKWQRVVHFPQQLIYSTVADVGAYRDFLPWCLSSDVSERALDASGAGELQTEIKVGWKHLVSTFRSNVTLTPMERVHAVSEPNEYMEHLSFTWSFASMGPAKCRLDLELDFSLRKPEHVLAWELAQEQIISEYVHCFSRRCQALEARASSAREGPPPDASDAPRARPPSDGGGVAGG